MCDNNVATKTNSSNIEYMRRKHLSFSELEKRNLENEIRNRSMNPRQWLPNFCPWDEHSSYEEILKLIEAARAFDETQRPDQQDSPEFLFRYHLDDAITATHEAAHLVVGEALGWTARSVDIIGDFFADIDGSYEMEETPYDQQTEIVSADMCHYRQRQIASVLAGLAIEVLLFRDWRRMKRNEGDSVQAFEIAESISNSQAETYKKLATGFNVAVSILTEQRHSVVKMAVHLLQRRIIQSPELSTLLSNSGLKRGERW
jgi:hypothetical protein